MTGSYYETLPDLSTYENSQTGEDKHNTIVGQIHPNPPATL